MNKIVQLSEREYKELFEKAKLNQDEIEKLAVKMYQDKGTFEIILKIDCDSDYYQIYNFNVHSHIYQSGELEKFEIPYEERKKIVKYVDQKVLAFMKKRFGTQITDINRYKQRLILLRNWKYKFIGITIFGWIAALALVLLIFLK